MSEMTAKHIAVIGGGISGLSAAWFLQQRGIDYTLLEASDRWGGKIKTEIVASGADQPFVVEAGPDSFIAQKPWAAQLARAIGLGDELIGTNDDRRKIFVLNRGRLTPMPDGLMLIVPTKFLPFALSPLISIPGKLRMAIEPLLPPAQGNADESLAGFVKRRLGAEVLDKLAEPLMSGIYNTDPDDQSLLATFPRFRALEQKYGSLTRGMIESRRQAPPASHGSPPPGNPPSSMFLSFRHGMESLVTALVAQLTGELRLNTPVDQIDHLPEGGYRVALSDGRTLRCDAVIVTTPAPITAALLQPITPDAAKLISAIRYVTTGTISLAYRAEDVSLPPSFGVVIPRGEQRPINAVTVSSTKFDHRAPAGYVLMRAFFGGSRSPATVTLDDMELIRVVREQLHAIYGITAEPTLTRICRWREATPQYAVGHLDHVAAVDAALPDGLYVTGSAYRGVGVPDCIHQSQLLVERIVPVANPQSTT